MTRLFAPACGALLLASVLGCAHDPASTPAQATAAQDKAPLAAPLPQRTAVEGAAVPMAADDALEPAADITAALEAPAAEVKAQASKVVGELAIPLHRGRPESALGIFAAESMLDGTERVTGARPDVCFTNMGGLRVNLDAGPITAGRVTELMPFDNAVTVFSMRGDALMGVLKRLAMRGDPAAGLRYVRDQGELVSATIGGAPVDPARVYRVCTNDYIFGGGGRYPFDGATDVVETGVLIRDMFMDTLKADQAAGKATHPKLDGRAQDKTEGGTEAMKSKTSARAPQAPDTLNARGAHAGGRHV